jgi:CRP/FNR family cyclic AMP-dependent transcriptional regulator
MSRWAGEMEFEFIEGKDNFVATDKVVTFLRNHLAKGEVQLAARLYEDTGANCAPDLLREAQSASSNTQKALAEMFLVARDFKHAAVVFELARQLERAAQLYEQGLDFDNAARAYEGIGDHLRAAVCLERAGKVDRAVELYKKAGPSQALAEALARQAHYYDAAAIYRHIFNLKAEIEMLRLVPATAENRVPAVLRLAELLEQYNYPDQAVGLLVETIRTVEAARFHQTMYSQLARLLDVMGRTAEAAQVRARMQNLLAAPDGTQPVTPSTPGPAPHANAVPVVKPAAMPASTVGPATLPPTTRDPFSALVDPFSGKQGTPQPHNDAYTFLKGIPIFAELRAEDMRDLYRACEEVTFGPGDVVVEQGVPGRGLFVIVQGDVRVVRQDAGAVTELARLGPGTYVGELSLLDAAPTSARVVGVGAVFALFISSERFGQFIMNHDEAARRVFHLFARTLAERLRTANVRK